MLEGLHISATREGALKSSLSFINLVPTKIANLMNTPNEKIVYIQRKASFIQEANSSDPEVKDYFDIGYKAIGSSWEVFGRTPATGMTQEELKIVMPAVLGFFGDMADARDRSNMMKETMTFYKNINTKIPGEGLKLNVALKKPDEPISIDNPPVKPLDYIRWKHALIHRQVGNTFAEAQQNPLTEFYIDDQDAINIAASAINEKEDEASTLYHQIKRDDDKMEQILTLLGINTTDLEDHEMLLRLKEASTNDDNMSAAVNLVRIQKFIDVSSDRDLQSAYTLTEMVRVSLLDRVGTQYLVKDTGEVIGRTQKEAVLWFENPANSKLTNVLKMSLKELAKKKRRDTGLVSVAKREIPTSSNNKAENIELDSATKIEIKAPKYD